MLSEIHLDRYFSSLNRDPSDGDECLVDKQIQMKPPDDSTAIDSQSIVNSFAIGSLSFFVSLLLMYACFLLLVKRVILFFTSHTIMRLRLQAFLLILTFFFSSTINSLLLPPFK